MAAIASNPDAVELRELSRARRRYLLRRSLTAWAFLLPEVVVFVIFMLLPVGWVIRQSFMSGGVLSPARWAGLANWKQAVHDPMVVQAAENTVLFTAIIVPIIFTLSIAAASALRAVKRGGAPLRAAIYFPQLIPSVAAAQIWLFMIHPDFGVLNVVNRALHHPPIDFIGSPHPAFSLVVMFEVWRGIGYWSLFILAAMLAVPTNQYEAATLDGAGPLRRFWHVTLPGIQSPLTVAVLLSAISALQIFDSIYILTNGGPNGATQSIVTYMFQTVFQTGEVGYGAVLGLTFLIVIIVLTAGVVLFVRRRNRLQSETL